MEYFYPFLKKFAPEVLLYQQVGGMWREAQSHLTNKRLLVERRHLHLFPSKSFQISSCIWYSGTRRLQIIMTKELHFLWFCFAFWQQGLS
jgi:hypothetical protein